MPRVPQLEQRVQNAPLPGARFTGAPSPESYGAGVGETLIRLGTDMYKKEVDNADRTAVFEADRQAAELQLELQGKLSQVHGKNALGVEESIKTEWKDGIAKIQSGLTDRQRSVFDHRQQARSFQLQDYAMRHASKEIEAVQDTETEAGLKSAIDVIRANPESPLVFKNETERMKSLITSHAVRKGLMGIVTPEMLKTPEFYRPYVERGEEPPAVGKTYLTDTARHLRDQALSKAHREVVTELSVQGKDLAASSWFAKHKDALTAPDRDAVEKTIEESSTRGEAQRLVRGLLKEGKTESEIIAHIDEKIDNPKIVDLAHQLTSRHFREQAAITKDQVDQVYLEGANAIEQHPNVNPRLLIDPERWARLSIGERHALEERAKSLTKYEKPDRPNDDSLWLDFLALEPEHVATLSRREFDERYWSKFDNHTRQRAETQWNTYKDALTKKENKVDDPKVTASLTFKDQVNNAWALSGLVNPDKERSKWSSDEVKQFVRFEDEAARALQAYEMTKLEGKRHATPDEVRAVISEVTKRAVQKVFTEGFFWNSERPVIGLEEDEKKRVFVPIDKIPKDSLDDLRRYIESLGKTVTADKLRRAYGQRVLNNRPAFDQIVNE